MQPLRRVSRALVTTLLAAALAVGMAVPHVTLAAEATEASDIVLVLDFSGSILQDENTRTAFGDALDRIAARAEETSATLVEGDVTVSIVIFATSATEVGCSGLGFRENPGAVAAFAECLRELASTYRNGGSDALVENIGDDTNYVAAMEEAAPLLPADSGRPAIIFFTDGRHEVEDVPVSEVIPARERLFGERTPFGLLPVGLGVDPNDRQTLEAGLDQLRVTRDLERCEGGALEWPTVVFETAEAAGQAVGVALQDVSCTFTVATPSPEPTPPPTPTPEPTPTPTTAGAPVREIRLFASNATVELTWTEPADAADSPVEGYKARCRPRAGGDWIESEVASQTSARIDGLANGVDYACEVATIRASGEESWTPASGVSTPFGPPPAPDKPSVTALNGAARVSVAMPADAPVSGIGFECSSDGGTTWAVRHDVEGSQRVVDIAGLVNGTEYVCRATATNESGVGDPSPFSDVFRPCSGLIDCNPALVPLVGVTAVVLALVLAYLLWRAYDSRRVWITAQVDNWYTVTLGRGPGVGMSFLRAGRYNAVTGVGPASMRKADVKIRYRGGDRFDVATSKSRTRASVGRVVQVADPKGTVHNVVLAAYDEEPQPLVRAEEP